VSAPALRDAARQAAAGRADLLRRVHQALRLVGRALDSAAMQACEPVAAGEVAGVRPLQLDKVVAEAAMLMHCASFLGDEDPPLAATIDALARRAAGHARSDAVLVRLCREPFRALEHAAAHVHLGAIGHHDEHFDRFLQEVLDGDTVGGPERLPNHVLECHWLDQLRSGEAGHGVHPGLLGRTCVSWPLDLLSSSTADLYAFTHVVLYASDMGRRAAPWPRPPDEIAAEADAALAVALDADNHDLAAELLWTRPMLGVPWSAAACFGFEVLAAVQDEHGFLPGPQFGLQASDDEDWVLRTSYHATLVMGMLCAASLRGGREPPLTFDDAAAGADVVDALLTSMPPCTRSPRWLDALARLDAPRRLPLAPFVLAVTFRRAVAVHDLPCVRATLEAALEGSLADGPAVRQALGLLRRAVSLAEARPLGRQGHASRWDDPSSSRRF
jgi:hypothetical protein